MHSLNKNNHAIPFQRSGIQYETRNGVSK